MIRATLIMETKKCSECGRELPLDQFNKNRGSKDGLQDRCRECFSKYNRKRYAKYREAIKDRVKRYKEENPANELETRLKACEKNPTAKNAYRAVDAAIRAGVIDRSDRCSGCGCSNREHRIEAHHSDYSRPLDVIWLCPVCHKALDAKRRVREGKTPYGVKGKRARPSADEKIAQVLADE